MNLSGRDYWNVPNDTLNWSSFEEEFFERASELQLTTLLLTLMTSLVGNGTLVFLFVRSTLRKRRLREQTTDWKPQRLPVVDLLVTFVGIAALGRDISGQVSQIANVLNDGCALGITTCRVQAFVHYGFRYLYFMYLALLYLERFVRHWRSDEHSMSFSVITVKVILWGLFLLVTSQMTGPLYGWGSYTFVPETWSCSLDLLSSSSCSFVLIVHLFFFLPAWTVMTLTSFAFLKGPPKDCMDTREKSRCSSTVIQDKRIKCLLCFTWFGVWMLSWPRALLETLVSCRIVAYPKQEFYFWTQLIESSTSLFFPVVVLASSRVKRKSLKKAKRQRPE